MAEIINLRMARKARTRDAAAQRAEANRRRFGQSAAERAQIRSETERAERHLAGARREISPEEQG